MTTYAADHEQLIIPYLAYRDAPAAIGFLHRAFGFEERFRMPMPDGRIGHAEVAYNGHTLMLASECQELGFASPRSLAGVHSQILVCVDDVDAHYERTKTAGATIATAPKDQYGMRSYRAMDLEGHRWIFWMPLPNASNSDPMGTSDAE